MQTVALPKDASKTERILAEGAKSLSIVARLHGSCSRNGSSIHSTTLARWALKGVRLADGRLVRLEAIRLGGRLVTSEKAFIRFVEAQQQLDTDGDDIGLAAVVVRSPAARRKASEEAARELEKLGC